LLACRKYPKVIKMFGVRSMLRGFAPRRIAAATAGAGAAGFAFWNQKQSPTSCDTKEALLGLAAGTAVGYGLHAYMNPEKTSYRPPRTIMILFGPPGSGKGTHGPKIEEALDIPQLSTGDMLRAAVAAKTEVGMKAKELMSAGKLVGDDIVIGIIKDRIREADCAKGFILDGFPRTLVQAKAIDKVLKEGGEKVNSVISLDIPDSVLEERICGRWIHKKSGRSYHVKFAPPKSLPSGATPTAENMKDDETGEALMQRPDDTATALVQRLSSYHSETVPVLKHYNPTGIVSHANANQKMDKVWDEISGIIKK
jgi:adenylate kinase